MGREELWQDAQGQVCAAQAYGGLDLQAEAVSVLDSGPGQPTNEEREGERCLLLGEVPPPLADRGRVSPPRKEGGCGSCWGTEGRSRE